MDNSIQEKKGSTKWVIRWIVIFILLSLVGTFFWRYNNFVALEEWVKTAWSQVENQYQRRSDLIPNIVNTVQWEANFEKSTGVICAVSKEYQVGQFTRFWFAFHPHQQEFLNTFQNSFVAFGCGNPENTLLIPFKEFEPFLKNCGTTNNEEKMYWHIVIHFRAEQYLIGQPGEGRGAMSNITRYKI